MTPDSHHRLERAWLELQHLPPQDLDDAIEELERRMIARAEGRLVPPPPVVHQEWCCTLEECNCGASP